MIPDLHTATFLVVFMSKSIQITVVVQRYSLLQFSRQSKKSWQRSYKGIIRQLRPLITLYKFHLNPLQQDAVQFQWTAEEVNASGFASIRTQACTYNIMLWLQ